MVHRDIAKRQEYHREYMRNKRQRTLPPDVNPVLTPMTIDKEHDVKPVLTPKIVDVKHTLPNRWFLAWMSRKQVVNDEFNKLTCFHVWCYTMREIHDQLCPHTRDNERMSICRNFDTGESWLIWGDLI